MGFTISKIFISVLVLFLSTPCTNADEFLIDGNSNSRVSIGDFECSPCPNSNSSTIQLTRNRAGSEITTGELWKFFNAQGTTSVRKLTLCLDVDLIDSKANVTLESFELRIQSPSNDGFITDVDFGDNSLVVRGYETTSFKPEAKLELNLDYDFMKEFSAESKEKILLKFEAGDEALAANPMLVVQSNTTGFLLNKGSWLMLSAFAGFWVLVFSLLNRFTKPESATTAPAKSSPIPKPELRGPAVARAKANTEDALSGSAF